MKVKATITKQDYMAFWKYAYSRLAGNKQGSRKIMIKNIVLWAINTVIILSIIDHNTSYLDSFHWPSALITAIPLLLIMFFASYHFKKMQKLSIPEESGLLFGDREIVIDDTGITETSDFGASYYKWTAVDFVEEVEGNIYVFFDHILGYIFPDSCFSNDNERQELMGIIRQHMS